MAQRYGIAIADDGMFAEATVLITRRLCILTRVRRWNSHDFLRNYLLLSRAVSLGLPVRWIRKLPDGAEGMVAGSLPASFTACTNETEYDHYAETLRNNIVAVYPDDAFLLTVPCFFVADAPESFISIAAVSGNIKIGIIRNNALVTVFHVKASGRDEIEGHIGRIEHSLRIEDPSSPPFEMRYLLNNVEGYDAESDTLVQVSCGSDDLTVIKAIGCALCSTTTDIPRLGKAPVASRFRFLRTALMATFASIAVITGLCIAALYGYNKKCAYRIDEAKRGYQHILVNNTEIRDLVAEGDSLAKKMVRVNRRQSNPSRWALLLQQLGTLRPSGLFIERIGSEVADTPSKARIVLAGWCETETIATDFVKALNKTPHLSGVTLSSIDRINEQTAMCRFKIVCVLSVSDL